MKYIALLAFLSPLNAWCQPDALDIFDMIGVINERSAFHAENHIAVSYDCSYNLPDRVAFDGGIDYTCHDTSGRVSAIGLHPFASPGPEIQCVYRKGILVESFENGEGMCLSYRYVYDSAMRLVEIEYVDEYYEYPEGGGNAQSPGASNTAQPRDSAPKSLSDITPYMDESYARLRIIYKGSRRDSLYHYYIDERAPEIWTYHYAYDYDGTLLKRTILRSGRAALEEIFRNGQRIFRSFRVGGVQMELHSFSLGTKKVWLSMQDANGGTFRFGLSEKTPKGSYYEKVFLLSSPRGSADIFRCIEHPIGLSQKEKYSNRYYEPSVVEQSKVKQEKIDLYLFRK